MKKFFFLLTALISISFSTQAMDYERARQEALFLTDKMAYELNLNDYQYEAAYEVNLDYFLSLNTYDDAYSTYWVHRNTDLSYILFDWQYSAFCAASYFYRPLFWANGAWGFHIYVRYPRHNHFFFGCPVFYDTYRGGHSWHHNGGRSWYHGRDFGHPGHPGMHDSYRGGGHNAIGNNRNDHHGFGGGNDHGNHGNGNNGGDNGNNHGNSNFGGGNHGGNNNGSMGNRRDNNGFSGGSMTDRSHRQSFEGSRRSGEAQRSTGVTRSTRESSTRTTVGGGTRNSGSSSTPRSFSGSTSSRSSSVGSGMRSSGSSSSMRSMGSGSSMRSMGGGSSMRSSGGGASHGGGHMGGRR